MKCPKWFFKIINRKYLKDMKIIKIKGYRTAILENKSGNRITSEFVWWIFRTKLEKKWTSKKFLRINIKRLNSAN